MLSGNGLSGNGLSGNGDITVAHGTVAHGTHGSDQRTPEWHAARIGKLTASNVGCAT